MTAIQSTTKPNRSNPDADLLALAARHAQLYVISDTADDDVPAGLISELTDLERQIVARPVFTKAGFEAKARVVALAEYDDDDRIIVEIMRLDHERVAG